MKEQVTERDVTLIENTVDWMQARLSDSSNCSLQCTSNVSPNLLLCLQAYCCHSVYLFFSFCQWSNNKRHLQIQVE